MKDFGAWFAQQGAEKPGETCEDPDIHLFRCCRCGKTELVTRFQYENGGTGWYASDDDFEHAVCGGSPFCLP